MPESRTPAAALSDGLSNRQVSMISIAGIIGAGLFIGSANAIAATGPAILLSYAITGLLVLLVMRMLGEMAVLNPDSGSFSTYATSALGQPAGFTVGWLYWWFWVLLIPIEAIAGADILHAWFSAVPSWAFTVGIIAVLTATNLLHVSRFGEFEFWFSLIKVLAIVAFIAVGALALFGVWPLADVSGVRHLYADGGFMPHGFGAVLTGILLTMFSFFGAEIVTIAAAESKRPGEKIRRAINLVVWRIALFYLLSIFLVVSLVSWSDPGLRQQGTFQFVLTTLNMPGARLIVDIVVFAAVCSCMNSGLYTASRMLFSLARRGDAPAACGRTSALGVPRAAVLASTLAGFAACIANYAFPGRVFSFLISTTGAIALLVYLVIAASQLVLRRRAERLGQPPAFRMWLFPWLTWAAMAAILAVLGYMFTLDDYREQGLLTLAVAGSVFLLSLYVTRGRPRLTSLRAARR